MPTTILKLLIILKTVIQCLRVRLVLGKYNKKNLYIFHDQLLAYFYNYIFNVPFCVMPHQPNTIAAEATSIYKTKYDINEQKLYKWFKKIEIDSYKKCDLIVMPTIYSLESYFNGYIDAKYSHKYYEILSSISSDIIN